LANYQNSNLARQKIWLNKENYAPKVVEVFDKTAQKLIRMDFSKFEYDVSFEDRAFDMQSNMTSWLNPEISGDQTQTDEQLASANPSLKETAAGGSNELPKSAIPDPQQPFGVIEPTYLPNGVAKQDMQEFQLGEHKAVMLRYSGDYHFTLTESHPETTTVSAMNGEVVDLGYTLGVLLGEEQQTLTWTDEGIEYKLTSAELPFEEMLKVAQSVQGQVGK
jgi:hypothetical protein